MSSLSRILVLAVAAVLTACGAARSTKHSAPAFASDAVLTEDDIAQSGARNAYDAVQWLCPPRVRSSIDERSIFVDGIRVRNPAVLQGVPTEAVHEIRWLDARDAVIRYGSANPDGVILVLTKPAI